MQRNIQNFNLTTSLIITIIKFKKFVINKNVKKVKESVIKTPPK